MYVLQRECACTWIFDKKYVREIRCMYTYLECRLYILDAGDVQLGDVNETFLTLCMCVHVCMYACTYVRAYIYIYICFIYVCVCMYVYIYIYIYIYATDK